jgi:hypothetical protein
VAGGNIGFQPRQKTSQAIAPELIWRGRILS